MNGLPAGAFNPVTGKLLTELSGRKAKVEKQSYDQVLNVVANGSVYFNYTPPAGELWRLKLLRIYVPAPASATSGEHEVSVVLDSDGNNYHNGVIFLKSGYAGAISSFYNVIEIASLNKIPATEIAQMQAMQNIVATNAQPFSINYINRTNVTQSQTAIIRMVREVEYIV
ncbi:hypothetical protein L1N85_11390 [Paenibacillus alkaliterrae]|uniref:hypothetical protein n=1 Tax=Paenibacillus alkaliterrae TaxID=320909 RepID=UPI001F430D15|nr:hypothetical protein [Paenibacillus alkaliterrae]MCF2939040.1 hypothetical protein [Paenibacillus alkaliterrae]